MRWLSVLVGLLVLVTLAAAQQCYQRQTYVPVQQQVYHEYPQQKIVAQDVVAYPYYIVTVPVVTQAVPIQNYGVSHYYSIQESYQRRNEIREILREELKNALTSPAAPAAAAPAYQHQAPPTPAAASPARIEPPIALKALLDTETPDEIQKPALAVFEAHCATCHGDKPLGESNTLTLVLSSGGDKRLARLSEDKKWKLYGMIQAGAMPPKANLDPSKLVPDAQMTAVLNYVSWKPVRATKP